MQLLSSFDDSSFTLPQQAFQSLVELKFSYDCKPYVLQLSETWCEREKHL